MLGVFGNGPLSRGSVQDGATRITYERFIRQTVPTSVEIAVGGVNADKVEISVAREFLNAMMALEVRPDSVQKRLDADALVFDVPATNGIAHLELHYRPRTSGLHRVNVGVDGAPGASFWQLIYF